MLQGPRPPPAAVWLTDDEADVDGHLTWGRRWRPNTTKGGKLSVFMMPKEGSFRGPDGGTASDNVGGCTNLL